MRAQAQEAHSEDPPGWLKTSTTTLQHKNAFRIQSPRLHPARIERSYSKDPAFHGAILQGSYGKESMNSPTRSKHPFSCFHDSALCSSQKG